MIGLLVITAIVLWIIALAAAIQLVRVYLRSRPRYRRRDAVVPGPVRYRLKATR